jgi:hypothetical protein
MDLPGVDEETMKKAAGKAYDRYVEQRARK